MNLYTIVISVLLCVFSVFAGGMQWQKMKAGDKKIGNWVGVAIVGALGFWGLIIIIRGMVL